MTHTYNITGMTCGGCKASIEKYLNSIEEITAISIDLKKGEAEISMKNHISIHELQQVLPEKYSISKKSINQETHQNVKIEEEKSKLNQLKPLILILFYITVASNLLHYKDWNISDVMLDFMGLFYIVFSFFKMLDLKGFPESFKMYDPLAKNIPVYAKIYPFIETALGLFFLMRFEIELALIVTLIILGITTIGVIKTLLDKKSIRCACLGTALNLPMTEATFIENSIMIVMAIIMLFGI